jgi:hypothetical protein
MAAATDRVARNLANGRPNPSAPVAAWLSERRGLSAKEGEALRALAESVILYLRHRQYPDYERS